MRSMHIITIVHVGLEMPIHPINNPSSVTSVCGSFTQSASGADGMMVTG